MARGGCRRRSVQLALLTTMTASPFAAITRLRLSAVGAVAVSSLRTAAGIVAGWGANGWVEWRNRQGQTLDAVYRQQG